MATRQNSSNGKPKSPRIQVVLPEAVCSSLAELAELESRTVSNMAKVLIQEGIKRYQNNQLSSNAPNTPIKNTQEFISSLEKQKPARLKGAPKRIKFYRN